MYVAPSHMYQATANVNCRTHTLGAGKTCAVCQIFANKCECTQHIRWDRHSSLLYTPRACSRVLAISFVQLVFADFSTVLAVLKPRICTSLQQGISSTSVVLSHTATANALDFLVFRQAPDALSQHCMASLTICMSAGAVTKSVTSAQATTVVLWVHHPIRMPGSFCSRILSKGIRHSVKSNMLIGHPCWTEHCICVCVLG